MALCLVTGGGGFIGSHLVASLVANGNQVRVLDNFSTGNLANLDRVRNQIELVKGDVADLDSVRAVEKRIEFFAKPDERPWKPASPPVKPQPPRETPPHDYQEHCRLMLDLMALAFWTDQTRVILQNGDPQLLEGACLFARRGLDHRPHPVHHGAEVDLHGRDVDAEALGVSRERRDLRAPEHDLRGNAPVVVALPAEPVTLRHGDAEPALVAKAERDLGPGPAATDHEHVETLHPTSIARSHGSGGSGRQRRWDALREPEDVVRSYRLFTSTSRARLSP